MRRALFGIPLLFVVGCAALIDINEYSVPDAADDAGPDVADAAPPTDASPPDVFDAACGPATMVQNLTRSPEGVRLAVDDENVYFAHGEVNAQNGKIYRCSKCGCDAGEEVADLNNPSSLAVDDTGVYFTDSVVAGSVGRLDKKTLGVMKIDSQVQPITVITDANYIYWSVLGSGSDLSTAGVWRANKSDLGSPTRLAATQSERDVAPYGLATDDTYLYFTTAPDIDNSDPNEPCKLVPPETMPIGTVQRVLKGGGPMQTPDVLATNQACPVSLAVDDSRLYWLTLGLGTELNGQLSSLPKTPDAGAPKPLVTGIGRGTSLSLYAGRLAWTSPADFSVKTCPVADCSKPFTLSTPEANPAAITADSTGIYWVTTGTAGMLFQDAFLRRAPAP